MLAVVGITIAGVARGQDATPPTSPPPTSPTPAIPSPPSWRFAVEPSAWYVAPGGDLKLPGTLAAGNGSQVQLEFLNIDSPRLTPMLELRGQSDRWGISVSGFSMGSKERFTAPEFAVDVGATTLLPGELFSARLEISSLEAIVSYAAYPDFTGARPDGILVANLDLLGGVRAYEVSASVATLAGEADADEFLVEPVVGARLTLDITRYASIDVQSTIGGFSLGDSHSLSWDIIAGFQWRPTGNIGVQVGYRNLLLDLQSGRDPATFDYFGALAGLYVGGVFRF